MDSFLHKIIAPPRQNMHSLLFEEREFIHLFDQLSFVSYTFDDLAMACVLFRNKSAHLAKQNKNKKRSQSLFRKISRFINFTKSKDEVKDPKLENVVLVYCHAYGSSKFEGSRLLGICKERGMSLLLHDSRGSGESEGECITFGKKEKIDLLFLLLKMHRDFGFTRFLLWGRSMGCNAIIALLHELEVNRGDTLNAILENSKQRKFSEGNDRSRKSAQSKYYNDDRSSLTTPDTQKYMNNLHNLKIPSKLNRSHKSHNRTRSVKISPFDVSLNISSKMNESPPSMQNDNIDKTEEPDIRFSNKSKRSKYPSKRFNRFFNKVVVKFTELNPRESAEDILSGNSVSQKKFKERKAKKKEELSKTDTNNRFDDRNNLPNVNFPNKDKNSLRFSNDKESQADHLLDKNETRSKTISTKLSHNIPEFQIEILGMVLDSPYRSLKSLINDNAERFLNSSILAKISVKPAQVVLSSFLKKHINYNINKNQNKHLLPRIGCSCFFIISDVDEMVPKKRYTKTIAEYRPTGTKTGAIASLNTKSKHTASRGRKLLRKVLDFVEQHFLEKHVFKYDLKYFVSAKTRTKTGNIILNQFINIGYLNYHLNLLIAKYN